MEMMSDSPSSILEVREMIGTVMQPCEGITSSFSLFFLIKWHQLVKALRPLLCYIILIQNVIVQSSLYII